MLVTFGLIHPRRRIETIIDLLVELRHRGRRALLWVVGGVAEYDAATSHAYLASLKELARSQGLDDLIHWFNDADPADVSACLQAADVCVLLYPDGASGRNTTLQAAREHGAKVVTTEGRATSRALRETPKLTFLPADGVTASDLADAIADISAAEPHRSTPNVQEHVLFHLGVYRRLLKAGEHVVPAEVKGQRD